MSLPNAIEKRHRAYLAAIDRLRDLASPEAENETYDLTATLREAVTLVGVLRRMAKDRSATEIHQAFGAPGDFGYDTPIGDALSRLYRGATTARTRTTAARVATTTSTCAATRSHAPTRRAMARTAPARRP